MPWFTEGSKLNALAGDILATTEDFTYAREVYVTVLTSTTMGLELTLRVRNAANTASLRSQDLLVGQSLDVTPKLGPFYIGLGEHIDVVAGDNAATSTRCQVSLFVEDKRG